MEATYWIKQKPNEPAFPEIEWSKPENKRHAKSLVIIGGNTHGFTNVAAAYSKAEEAGIGRLKAVLPDAAIKQLRGTSPVALEGVASNSSGGFSRKSVPELLAFTNSSDGVLLAGDFGRNSETAITINEFLEKYSGPVVATKDAINYFITDHASIENRSKTYLVMNLAQIQKLAKNLGSSKAITFEGNLSSLVEALHDLTEHFPLSVVTMHHSNLIVAHNGKVSTTLTETESKEDLWQLEVAAKAAVYILQHPAKEFEALTSSLAYSV